MVGREGLLPGPIQKGKASISLVGSRTDFQCFALCIGTDEVSVAQERRLKEEVGRQGALQLSLQSSHWQVSGACQEFAVTPICLV